MEVKPSECNWRILKVNASPAFMHFAIRWHSARLTGMKKTVGYSARRNFHAIAYGSA